MYALCVDKTVQKKLRDALLAVPTDDPTMDQLNEIEYLDFVVRETLRIHPPVPATVREALRDDIIPLATPYRDTNGQMQDSIQ